MKSRLFLHSVAEGLRLSPDLVQVFLAYQTDCVGCVMAGYCNFHDVMDFYQLSNKDFGKKVMALLGPKLQSIDPVDSKGG